MPDIHSSAVVSSQAELADDVVVGPFAIIDGPARIGPGCEIAGQAWIKGSVEMGSGNKIGYGAIIGGDPQDLSFDPSSDTGVTIGNDNTIREYVTINRATVAGTNNTVGHRNYLMTGVHLGHDVVMGNDNIFANNVLVAGFVAIGDSVFVGGGAVFHQFIRLGDYALAQGISGASKDLPPYCVLHKVNKLGGLNIIGLRRAGFSGEERKEIKSAYAILFQKGLPLSEAVAEATSREWGPAARRLVDAVQNPTKKGVLSRGE